MKQTGLGESSIIPATAPAAHDSKGRARLWRADVEVDHTRETAIDRDHRAKVDAIGRVTSFCHGALLGTIVGRAVEEFARQCLISINDLSHELAFLAIRAGEEASLETSDNDVAQFARGHFQLVDGDSQFVGD